MNYFEFFNIPVAFNVDLDALKKTFYSNSKKFHPDYHSLSDETQQAWALEQSTLNNQGYGILSDDDLRIKHILEIKGLIGDQNVNPVLPPDFLMEMMDINEAIMDLQLDFDADRYRETLETVDRFEKELLAEAAPALKNYTDDGRHDAELEVVKNYFLKKKYLLRIRENLSTFASAF